MPGAPYTLLSTVTVPATSYLLADREAFKRELKIQGTADDAYIGDLLKKASAAVARYCNRPFAVEEILDEFWPERDASPHQVPGGLEPLQLSRWPIVSVASVFVGLEPLVANVDFRVDNKPGQLVRLGTERRPTRWSPHHISVAYTAGYAEIPEDLSDVVTRMMRARWFARDRDPQLRSENIAGVYEAAYWFAGGPGAGASGLPPDIEAILDSFRVPVVA